MTMKVAGLNPDQWKQKALELAQELDEQQASRERNEKRLVRALIRLALTCEGQDPGVDPYLVQLREILRKGILNHSRLEKVDALTDTILRAGKGQAPVAPNWQGELLEFLAECAPGLSERQRIEGLAVSLPMDPQVFRESLSALFYAEEERQGRWKRMQQWFGRQQATATSDDRFLRQQLAELLAEIEIPPVLVSRAEALSALLQGNGSMEEALQQTARLLAALNEHLQKERLEIENFLAQLTDRLQALESQTRDVGQLVQSRDTNWNQNLSAEVSSLRLQTLQETDLKALKAVVSERLDIITIQLKSFREAEVKRVEEAENKIAALTLRMREMEQESADLQQRLRLANQLALYDSVTALPNRKAVDEHLQQEIGRWKRFGSPFSLLLWDIDHFKLINDRFGHHAGDKALRVVADTLRKGIRKVDFVGRYGGEEFLMLLPGTESEGARQVAEKLRQAVKDCGFNSRGKAVPVTISCGITNVRDKDTPQSLFERADQALYQAKENGRDQCICL